MAGIPQLYARTLAIVAMTVLPLPTMAQQTDSAREPSAGLHLFLATGCDACHRIAGTRAQGRIGPDLTHLASREMIGAKLLPMSAENLAKWIRHTQDLKPGARMPSFEMLPSAEIDAIVDYLVTLQ